jgi:HAD superfamily hydrolase (TIGR01662 family)
VATEYALGLFDVGWCLFDEDPRWWKTCCWMSDTIRGYDIFVPPEEIKIEYENCCSLPDLNINSVTRECLHRLGLPANIVDTLCKRHPWHTYDFRPYRGAAETLKAIAATGARVAILSNQGQFTRNVLVRHGFDKLCNSIILSSEEGMSKPNPEFFKLACDKFNVEPRDILYFGDRLDHDIHGAACAGMDTALVRQGPHRRQLRMPTTPTYEFNFISEVVDAVSSGTTEERFIVTR